MTQDLATSMILIETVDYNNDTLITDLVPIKKLETIKEEDDEEDGLDDDDDDDDVKFIKKTHLHPQQRLKRLSENNLIKNETDKKIVFLKYYIKKG